MSTAPTRQQQQDIKALLATMSDLSQISVLAAANGDTVQMLTVALAGKYRTGKLPGASITVEQPEELPSEKFAQFLMPEILHTVTVIELVMENRLQDGSGDFRCGYSADELKDLVRQRLHGRPMGNAVLMWRGVKPFNQGNGVRGYEITFALQGDLSSEVRATPPRMSASGTTVTLTGSGAGGEAMYYTIDGSTPIPGESGTTIYTIPFTCPSGDVARAAATATGKALSDASQLAIA